MTFSVSLMIIEAVEQVFLTETCQSEAMLHCLAALSFASYDLHRRQADSDGRDYKEAQLKHNSMALIKLQADLATIDVAVNIISTMNTVALLAFLAVSPLSNIWEELSFAYDPLSTFEMLTESALYIAKRCEICSPSSKLPNGQSLMKDMAH
jgi:hypothetical protein